MLINRLCDERGAVKEAEWLIEEPGTNPEYERGICELLGAIFAQNNELTADAARRFARILGVDRQEL